MTLHMRSFLLTLFISSMHLPVYCINKLDDRSTSDSNILLDEEQQLIDDARKKLTERGFNAVKTCTFSPKTCDSLLIYTILNGDEFEKEGMFSLLETQCYPRHYRKSAVSLLSPWISDEYIEEIFQNDTSSLVRVNVFKDTLIPLIKKLSELFLIGKIK